MMKKNHSPWHMQGIETMNIEHGHTIWDCYSIQIQFTTWKLISRFRNNAGLGSEQSFAALNMYMTKIKLKPQNIGTKKSTF